MDHISTLCALSTVGIATSGLALGRVERTKSSIFRRKTLPYDSLAPTQPTFEVRPKTSVSSRPGHAGLEGLSTGSGTDGSGSRTSQFQGSDLRRASLSFGAARLRRRGQTLTNPPLRIPEDEQTNSSTESESHWRRPSTSWLRRLSMVSFQSESQTTNSPVTPSFTGSSSPIFSRPSSSRRSSNKLVKRSTSQHSNAHPLFVNTSPRPTTALRRPATSYQRSETIRLQSPLATSFEPFSQPSGNFAAGEFEVEADHEWQPYLTPKSGGLPDKLVRRLSTTGTPRAQGVRQIVSDQNTVPALILATAIVNKNSSLIRDSSIPTSPVLFRDPFETSTAPLPAQPMQKPVHKHSYSHNDVEPKRIIVNTVTGSGTPLLGRPRGGSLKRVKGRTFSVSRSELSRRERQEHVHPGSPRSPPLPQRRNITDPAVFCRPAVCSEFPPSDFAPRSVSQDYNIGLRGRRPLTSDAVALSTWQHACRPDGYQYSSLRRRPKRDSITASDPSSTVIGSDVTRVFTTSDEYETDMMSDYWDSVRTRETSGSGLKGLRIETMFDKAGTRLSNEEVMTLEELLPRGSFASRLENDPPLFAEPLLPLPCMIGALPGEVEDLSQTPLTISLSNPFSGQGSHVSSPEFPPCSPVEDSHQSQKINIFDWSEQSRTNGDVSDTEARPRTVHGKNNAVNRGSRAACRKVPSAIHLRSQSVPVARELPTNDTRQTSGKFGTWGLGSKGVSEDWDSDFDFDAEESSISQNVPSASDTVTPRIMTVPKAILERQASLRGQFGQVQELTMLVQELKRLRHQASIFDLIGGPSSELWKEAEGIVNLATIDDEEDRRSPPGSPSSLTFSFDDSDEEGLNASSKRNTTLPAIQATEGDSEGPWQSGSQPESQLYGSPLGQLSRGSPKSKSVIDIIRSNRPDGSTLPELGSAPRTQKLPFDTQSLRDLVVRAGVVTRALKEVIRKAEGVDPNSEDVFPADPPFRRIFDQPDDVATALAEMH
ncbi:uncharacterized protein N7477_008074 [Penicillium maclennaniae]|uniref:uncharacterized protein n=1 Tax=Penicillium maclennaniae TaxID=1343394 RepID=UPI00253FE877|nr:uncharacterized protein N7477_008074 [Penicillium maclennaniae]KAJ5665626.1 hypothetical protein N7477_008074 [Penicillium maclennaniae]